MDFFSHIFWTAIVFHSYKPLWLPLLFGALPDISSWGILFVYALATGNFKKLLDAKTITLANADDVKKIAGVSIGAVPPFGNLFGVQIYIDKSVTANDEIAFNAGLHTKSIIMKSKDLVKVTGAKGGEFSR